MIKVPGHFKFFANYYKFFALFLGLISKFFASPTVLFLSPTVLFTIKSDRSFSDSLVSSLRVRRNFSTIQVPGFSSKSDGTFHHTFIKFLVIFLSPTELFTIKVSGHFKFFALFLGLIW